MHAKTLRTRSPRVSCRGRHLRRFTVALGGLVLAILALAPEVASAQRTPTLSLKLGITGSWQGSPNTSRTDTRTVTLQFAVSGGTPTHVRFGANSRLTGANWLSWRQSSRYSLPSNLGTHRVYAQVKIEPRVSRGTKPPPPILSAIVSDSIQYLQPLTITSFRINNGASSTDSQNVSLSWSNTGTATHYRAGNTSNLSGKQWSSLPNGSSGTTAHTLDAGGIGNRTVYFELRNTAGTSDSSSDTINLSKAICPTGPNGKQCNGDGQCQSNGTCSCKSDFSGAACETICQRCYGAAGNNCGPADGFTNVGLCVGNLCTINAGSWEHDECCVAKRRNGPAAESQQGSCSPPISGAPPPHVCQPEFNKAIAHLAAPGLSWTRTVNTSRRECTTTTMPVRHQDMCNPSGGTLLCTDTKYCCSRSGKAAIGRPGMCVCD